MLENGFLVDGKYKILDVIGRGGMSIVYLAINEKANRSWAVKELIRTDPRAAGISKKETDLLKKLHHPGIAGIVDVIEQKESQLIVMDYVEGHSLAAPKSISTSFPSGFFITLDGFRSR